MRIARHFLRFIPKDDGAMDFSVKATLGYRVGQDTPFVFNMQAQQFAGQSIIGESLRITPELPAESWTMPESAIAIFG
jgi:hypothetical protein